MFWIWIIHTLGEENLNFRSTPCLSVALKLSMHFSKLNKLHFNTATQFKYQGHLIFAALLIIGQAEVRVKFIIPLRCHPLFLTLFTYYLTMNFEHIALAPVVLCKCAKCANELVLLNWSPRDPESPLRILDLICFWCQYLWIVPKADRGSQGTPSVTSSVTSDQAQVPGDTRHGQCAICCVCIHMHVRQTTKKKRNLSRWNTGFSISLLLAYLFTATKRPYRKGTDWTDYWVQSSN